MSAGTRAGGPAGSADPVDRNKVLFVLMIALAMSLIQVSSVVVALEAIQESMHATPAQLQWVLSGYALMIGLVLVPAGRLGDLFGQAKLFTIGLALFTITSVACGLASDATTLNMLRLAQGAAAGVFSPQVTGLIQRHFSGQARAKAFALFGLVISASVAAGPLMAGIIIDLLGPEQGWRATFGINLPLGVAGVATALWWLPFRSEAAEIAAKKQEGVSRRGRLDVDPVGVVLLVAGVLCIMLPFMLHGSSVRWLLLPVAALLLASWVWWERRYERRGNEPMVHMSMFAIRSFSFSTGVMTLQFLGVTSQFVVATMFLQSGLGEPALAAGLLGLPNAVASAVASMWSARYTIRHGRLIIVGALGLMVLGLVGGIVALQAVGQGASWWWLSVALMVSGFGQGAMGSAAQTQAMLEVPRHAGGTAGGVTQTAQRIATAIGNTMITGIMFGVLAGTAGDTAGWVTATSAAFAAISVILVCALAVAIWFLRDARLHPAGPGH